MKDMQAWVHRALAKWPNVPHVYGWVRYDRRGRWWLKDSMVERPKLIDMMRLNLAPDERGCWFVQNGPQRVYVELEAAPWVWRLRCRIRRGSTGWCCWARPAANFR